MVDGKVNYQRGAVVAIAVILIAAVAVIASRGPDDKSRPATDAGAKTAPVTVAGEKFNLELALDDKTRFHGLSDRTDIAPDGGMLFCFTRASVQEFVMRDCPIPIDIIYLDPAGRVVAFYKMVPEPPRSEEEQKLTPPFKGAPDWAGTNDAYEKRLKRYPSGFASQFVIELKGNTLDRLKIAKGDKVDLDVVGLKARAK